VAAVLEQDLLVLAAVAAALVLQERGADKEERAPPPARVALQLEAALPPARSAAVPQLELWVVEPRDPQRQTLHLPHLRLLQRHQAKIPRPAAG
jgi:hypothetical protein